MLDVIKENMFSMTRGVFVCHRSAMLRDRVPRDVMRCETVCRDTPYVAIHYDSRDAMCSETSCAVRQHVP